MKLQVTASLSPRAAAARRTRRSTSWPRVAVGRATPSARGSGGRRDLVVARRCGRLPRPGRPGRRRRGASSGTVTVRRRRRAKPSALEDRAAARRPERRRRPAPRVSAGSKRDALRARPAASPARIDAARLAAANVEDQPGQQRQPVVEERRVDPALEAAARIGGQAAAPGRCAAIRSGVEIGAFEQDVGGRRR